MSGEPVTPRPRRTARLLFVAVAVLVAAVFAEACFGLFLLYDDPLIVTENPALRGSPGDALRWALLEDMGGNWVPVAALTHVLDVSLFGFDPFFHHLVSVLFHAAAAGAFAVFLLRVTGSVAASAIGALAWAVHPLRVESVAWVAERRDVVSGLFLMLTLLAWERWSRLGERRDYRLALAWALLGLLSKPTMVVLPVLLLVVDVWPLARHKRAGWGALVVEKVPVLLLAAFVGVATFLLQRRGGALTSLDVVGASERIGNAVVSWGRYVGKTLWPVDLVVPYGIPQDGWPPGIVLAILAAALALFGAGAVLARRGSPALLAALVWFTVALGPVIGLIRVGVASMANRYTYLPHVLAAVVVAVALARITDHRRRRAARVVGALVVVVLAAATAREVPLWHDTRRLFTRTVEVDPANSVAWNELAIEAVYAGRLKDAVEPARKSVEHPPAPNTHHDLLVYVLAATGDHKGAVEAAVDWLTVDDSNTIAHARLAISLFALGDVASARSEAQRARQGMPLPPQLEAELARAEGPR